MGRRLEQLQGLSALSEKMMFKGGNSASGKRKES